MKNILRASQLGLISKEALEDLINKVCEKHNYDERHISTLKVLEDVFDTVGYEERRKAYNKRVGDTVTVPISALHYSIKPMIEYSISSNVDISYKVKVEIVAADYLFRQYTVRLSIDNAEVDTVVYEHEIQEVPC